MYRIWDPIIEPVLKTLQPETIVEIGSDEPMAKRLLEFCQQNDAKLHIIDPLPKYDVAKWQESYGGHVDFHLALSLNALPLIDWFDVVLIDGDHNWYTVFNELKLIEKRCANLSQPFPLVMLHDIGWPYGRRDLYHDPETIPYAYRKPYMRKGMRPESPKLLEEGGLNQYRCNALNENDSQSGVLTAVEDFLKETEQQFELVKVPGLHGLGILVSVQLKESNKKLGELLESLNLTSSAAQLIEHVERARLEVEIERQETAAALKKLEAKRKKELEHLRAQAEALLAKEAEMTDVRQQLADNDKQLANRDRQLSASEQRLERRTKDVEKLVGWIEELDAGISALLASRQWKVGHAVSELRRRALLKPRLPMVPDRLNKVRGNFRAWRRRFQAAKARPGSQGRAELREPESSMKDGEGPPAKAPLLKEELAREIRRRLGPVPEFRDWPSVSIIVLNRNGLDDLKRLLSGLQHHTDYPSFEVVLVDNGSTDSSTEFVRSSETRFPVRLIQNPHDISSSAGSNQGAEAATGELLLFLKGGVTPFDPGWLKELVASMKISEADAAGTLLVCSEDASEQALSGYAVEHRGVRFRRESGLARSFSPGAGSDVLDENPGVVETFPATTAACLLIKRDAFDSVGGFTQGYRQGTEGIDLGLKLTESGRKLVCSGRAVLLREEHSARTAEAEALRRIDRANNLQLFLERWGPRLHREILLDRLESSNFWSEGPAHIAITVSSHDVSDGYGDWYTAHEIGDALEIRGWRVTYVQRKNNEWYSLPRDTDYLLALLHQYNPACVPGMTTIAWIRNWTDKWVEHDWFEHFDVVLVSSSISAKIVERSTNKATTLFPIATNPKRFTRTPPNPTYEADYVFTGNHWREEKGGQRLINSLNVAPNERVMIFGKGWEHIPRAARYARGHLPYDQLPQVYSSIKLLIDDAGFTTRPYGSVNSRVFDALGMGTLVVSNCEEGVRELFDRDFPTYSNRQELRANLDLLLNNESRRNELARRYQEIVLRDHTYERRAEQLTELLSKRVEALSFCIKIGPPNWLRAPSWGDTHFARAIQRQLERRGHSCRAQVLEEWDNFEGLKYDVAIHLKGLEPYVPKSGQFNVLWNISHPDLVTAQECDKYHLVFVASERWANRLRSETSTPVIVLEQATDPEIFFPDQDLAYERDLIFVGNSRKVERRIIRDLLPTKHDLAVWGGDWEGLIDEKYVAGDFLPNDQVRKAYSSAAIVLNDHWDDMREHGFISNRIYDALACGALVISDYVPEIEERLGDAVVTYRTPEELKKLVSHYLASPEERAEKGRRGRELVLAGYTFEQRVDAILREVTQHLEENGFRTRIQPLGQVARSRG